VTETLTRRRLNRATLARQLLLARAALPAGQAIEQLGGLQAQEAKPPFVGLWSRLSGFERRHLHDALGERAAVRSTFLRATLHLTSAADYAAFRSTIQPVLTKAMGVLGARADGLDVDALLPVARDLLAEAPRTFNELRPLLQESFPEVNERALGYAVRTQLPLVMVPTGDPWGFPPVASFTLAETWLDEPLADANNLESLLCRYLAAFGPATPADMQTWSGLQGLKGAFDAVRPNLRTFRNEQGRELFDLPDAPRPDGDVPAPARFLPEFDNLVLAHADRTRVLADAHRGAVVTKNLRVRSTFLWDGFVAGTWTAERKRSAATLLLTPFARLPKGAFDELAGEGETLLRFLEPDTASVDVRLVPIR
jgi:winged helix DNA-binding protein